MLELLLIVGFLCFWGVITYLAEGDESPTFALVLIALAIGLVVYFQGVTWAGFLATLPLILYGALAYVAIGVLWSVARWTFYVRRLSETYGALRAQFLADNPGIHPDMDAARRAEMKRYIGSRMRLSQVPPSLSASKSKLYGWLVLWPFSATWTLTHEPARIVFNWAHGLAQSTYRRIADYYFREFSKDFD